MYQLTLPDARTIDLPTRWGELTLGQSALLAELPDGADVYSFLAVLLSLSPLEVMNLPAAFVNEQVLPSLAFSTEEMPSFSGFERPSVIRLLAQGTPGAWLEVPVLSALDIMTFGQATDIGALLQDATVPVSQKRIQTLAIVLYPAYHGTDYDSDQVPAFAEKICSHALMEEALPLTDFFLSSTTASDVATPASSSAFRSVPTSAPLVLKPSWRNGMRWLWSMHWPLGTKPSGPTSGASSGAR